MSATTVQSQGLFGKRSSEQVSVGKEEITASLQAYFGESVIVGGFSAVNRRDYTGGIATGGALVVECSLLSEEGERSGVVEIDDNNRRLKDEAVITALGAEAMGKKPWIRDSCAA